MPRKSSRGKPPRTLRAPTPEEEDIATSSSVSSDTDQDDNSSEETSEETAEEASKAITTDTEDYMGVTDSDDSDASSDSDLGPEPEVGPQEAGPQEAEPQEVEPQEVDSPEEAEQAGLSSAARLHSTPLSAAEKDAPLDQTSTRILWVFPPAEGTDEPIEIVQR